MSTLALHCRRVSRMAQQAAAALGLPTPTRDILRRAAWAHDLGKLAIPRRILEKPGPLTRDEMAIMRLHTLYGEQICRELGLGQEVALAARCHHERWNGSGYPDGLSRQEIPLVARIIAVCDVYEALTSPRPYRRPWRRADVHLYIVENAGRLFDPDVVAALFGRRKTT